MDWRREFGKAAWVRAFRDLARVYRDPLTWAIAAGAMLAGVAVTVTVNWIS